MRIPECSIVSNGVVAGGDATAAAQAGVDIPNDIVAGAADVAAGVSTVKAVRAPARFAELVHNTHADLARIDKALQSNPGRILAGVEKIIQSDLKLIAEKIPTREREAFE